VDWNAVWQVIHLYVSGGGCLGQRGFRSATHNNA
jgi:hypothetical protein